MRKTKPELASEPDATAAIENFIGDQKDTAKDKKKSAATNAVKEAKPVKEVKDAKKTKTPKVAKAVKETKDDKKAEEPKKTKEAKDKESKFLITMKKSVRKQVKIAATELGISMNTFIVEAAMEKLEKK